MGAHEGGVREEAFTTIQRERNVMSVLEVVRHGGALSRLDIAKVTGLSKPTVSAALQLLEGGGIVKAVGFASGGRGPKASLYTIEARSVLVLGLAIGSRFLRATVADLQGKTRFEEDVPLLAPDLSNLLDAVGHVRARIGAINGTLRLAVAGVPGVVDAETGIVRSVPNITGLEGRGIAHLLSDRLGVPALAENDVNLAAIGEREFGQDLATNTYAYVLLGTGVGAGIVLNGELYRGSRGAAGEVGFLPLGPDPFSLAAGSHSGALERRLSGHAIVAYAQALASTTPTELREPYTTAELFDAARRGDPLGRAVTAYAAREIALVVATLGVVLDVGLVMLGGGIGSRSEFLLGAVREHLSQLVPWPPTVTIASLGDGSIRLGAVARGLDAAVPAVVRDLVAADSELSRESAG